MSQHGGVRHRGVEGEYRGVESFIKRLDEVPRIRALGRGNNLFFWGLGLGSRVQS